MNTLRALLVVAVLCLVQNAGATKPLAPSKLQALCEKALIRSGLVTPVVRARIHSPPPFKYDHQNHVIQIGSEIGPDRTTFNRTNRDLYELRRQRFYPREFLTLNALAGLKILDIGCGDGNLVEELRRKGVDIEGLDVFLDKYQLSKPYYIQAGADSTGEPDQSYDLIISTQGPLSWDQNLILAQNILKEVHRLLKPGGRFLISAVPINHNQMDFNNVGPDVLLKGTVFAQLPNGLKIKSAPDKYWLLEPAENTEDTHANYWLELIRE